MNGKLDLSVMPTQGKACARSRQADMRGRYHSLPSRTQPTRAHFNMLQWHGQAQVHGLSKLSPVLALHIHRFDDRGNRLHFSISDFWSIDIPLFIGQTLATQSISHEVSAIILHSGETVSQGHCSAVLLEDGSPRFLTADGKRATKIKAKDIPQICQNAYIIILRPKPVTV